MLCTHNFRKLRSLEGAKIAFSALKGLSKIITNSMSVLQSQVKHQQATKHTVQSLDSLQLHRIKCGFPGLNLSNFQLNISKHVAQCALEVNYQWDENCDRYGICHISIVGQNQMELCNDMHLCCCNSSYSA